MCKGSQSGMCKGANQGCVKAANQGCVKVANQGCVKVANQGCVKVANQGWQCQGMLLDIQKSLLFAFIIWHSLFPVQYNNHK